MAYEALATESYVQGQIPAIVDNVTSTSTTSTLSANQGKVLNDRIDNLSNIGRYLALWDCSTGLPTTNPGTLPYTYKSGDYYRVSKISVTYTHNISLWHGNATKSQAITTLDLVITNFSETPFTTATLQQYFIDNGYTSSSKIYPCTGLCGEYSPAMDFDGVISWAGTHFDYYSGTSRLTGNAVSGHYISDNIVVNSLINYKPNGDSYSGVTSTTQESNAVATGDVYFYDGTTWSLQINHLGAFVEDVQVAGTSIVSSGVANITANNLPELSTDKITSGTFADARIASASTWNAKATKPFITSISLPTASWVGDASPYSQVITITGSTANSKIDLQPDATTINHLVLVKTTALYVENNNGTLTAYAIGSKPTQNLTIQATVTETTT